ncbi:MAG TPA: dienelactone hydrolase family protein [Candidatus Obscuribacterales bacterium]
MGLTNQAQEVSEEGSGRRRTTVPGAVEDAFGSGAKPIDSGNNNVNDAAKRALGAGFELTGSPERPVDMKMVEKVVDDIEYACNGGLTGAGTDKAMLWERLSKLNAQEFAAVNKRFAEKHGINYAARGETWDVMRELKDELSDDDFKRYERMIADKRVNEVPVEHRTWGENLLKAGSDLKVGEMNHVKMADGREYDVYIPRNADSRAPVIVAMHGAGAGDMKGVSAAESGLTMDAERTGSIVVFAYPKPRQYDTLGPNQTGVAWNVPGRTNLTKEVDPSYDDRVYMDNVLAHLGTKTKMAEKVGIFGFSDGGRFAQVYAADRPDKVAGVVSIHGTWMDGDARPAKGVPIMIVHGTGDQTLPWNGGMGSTSRVMNSLVDTNIDKSQPHMQPRVWQEANATTDETVEKREGGVEIRTARNGNSGNEVKTYILEGRDHGLHDFKNNGSRFFQWLMGKPDLQQNISLEGAQFLKRYIVRDLAAKRS